MKLVFTGDIGFSKYFANSASDKELLSSEVMDFILSADCTVANFEGAIRAGGARTDKKLIHSNPIESIDFLSRINAKVWNMANNHAMDCGAEGIAATKEAASKVGAVTVGVGMDLDEAKRPLILDRDGGIGIVSVSYYENDSADENKAGCFCADRHEELILEKIRAVKEENRWCVVIAHCGDEFCQIPLPYIRNRYLKYLEYGADAVIGHHPHVVENYETVGDKVIFYSLGNFIFDTDYQRIQKYTDWGILVKLDFSGEKLSWEHFPIRIDRGTQRIVNGITPHIFTNVDEKQYLKLWPLSARMVCKNERKKYAFVFPHLRGYNGFKWLFCWELKHRIKDHGGWDLIKGRLLYYLGAWKKADERLVNYLREK